MKRAVCAALALLLALALVGCGEEKKYHQQLQEFQLLALQGGARAEGLGDMIQNIWHDTIYREVRDETRAYVLDEHGEFCDDFNVSLRAYFLSAEYNDAAAELEQNRAEVEAQYFALRTPPENVQDGYALAHELYTGYGALVNMVLHPSGSYNSYTQAFADADGAYHSACEQMDTYLVTAGFSSSY